MVNFNKKMIEIKFLKYVFAPKFKINKMHMSYYI